MSIGSIVIGKAVVRGLAVAVFFAIAAGRAMGAECRDGRPSLAFSSPPVPGPYYGSPRGTRVYGIVTKIRVRNASRVETIDGVSSLSCDAKRIVVRGSDGTTHGYPIAATLHVVLAGYSAVFAPLAPNAEQRDAIRDGRLIFVGTL